MSQKMHRIHIFSTYRLLCLVTCNTAIDGHLESVNKYDTLLQTLGISCKIFRFHKSTLALACREPPKGFQIIFFLKLAKAWLLCVIPANFCHGLRVAVADLLVLSSHASSVVSQQLGSCGFGMSSPSRTRQETHNVLCWNRLPAHLRPAVFSPLQA